jgi:D-3-phosphoglycerate dehydrogenase
VSRVLVTPRSLTGADTALLEPIAAAGYELVRAPAGRQPSEDELLELLPGCVGWVAGVEPIGRRVLDGAPDLRVISRNGAGVDNIDVDAARERSIAIVRAGGSNARGVAELTIALYLACARGVLPSATALRDGRWEREIGDEAAGRTLGVIGAGAIGQEVLMLGAALGMETVATDPYADAEQLAAGGTRLVELEELLAVSDAISLHRPAPQDGRPVLGGAELAGVKRGAILLNTARAGLVDDDAVLAGLDAGRLSAYATDVFEVEPPRPSALLRHPQVLATPHIGGFTRDSVRRSASAAIENLLEALASRGGEAAASGGN